jgi:hypothetical protein
MKAVLSSEKYIFCVFYIINKKKHKTSRLDRPEGPVQAETCEKFSKNSA